MPSFDVVSRVEIQEVKNAIEQVKREISTRYDFRNTKSSVSFENEKEITVIADDNQKLLAIQELLKQKLSKRGVSSKSVEFKDPQAAANDTLRQIVLIKQGLAEDLQKKINKQLKSSGLKINSQIQGDEVRVIGKKKDDLQEAIAWLKTNVTEADLQFVNFRD
jgi:uncharacterized protein YajQ (UPF0234 family)